MSESTNTASSKSGVGVGSASIVLIFAVLCLTVFTLITYIIASNNKALVDAEVQLVTGFYAADTLAERVLSEISAADTLPGTVYGIDIQTAYNEEFGEDTVYFYCPFSGDTQGGTFEKALYVSALPRGDYYQILSWHMVDTDEWTPDGGINVWDGS